MHTLTRFFTRVVSFVCAAHTHARIRAAEQTSNASFLWHHHRRRLRCWGGSYSFLLRNAEPVVADEDRAFNSRSLAAHLRESNWISQPPLLRPLCTREHDLRSDLLAFVYCPSGFPFVASWRRRKDVARRRLQRREVEAARWRPSLLFADRDEPQRHALVMPFFIPFLLAILLACSKTLLLLLEHRQTFFPSPPQTGLGKRVLRDMQRMRHLIWEAVRHRDECETRRVRS